MKKKRIKITGPLIQTRAEAETAVREIAELTLESNQLTVEMDQKITAVKANYEARLVALAESTKLKVESVQTWATANEPAFEGKRSVEMVHGAIGWRTGNWSLKLLQGLKWDLVLERLQQRPKLADYIRTKQEVDKEKIIADRDALAPVLPALGLVAMQEESFFVSPDLNTLADRQTTTQEAA